jgi:hypothetical protein
MSSPGLYSITILLNDILLLNYIQQITLKINFYKVCHYIII